MASTEKYILLVHQLFEGKISAELFHKEIRRLRAGELPLFSTTTSVPANGALARANHEKALPPPCRDVTSGTH